MNKQLLILAAVIVLAIACSTNGGKSEKSIPTPTMKLTPAPPAPMESKEPVQQEPIQKETPKPIQNISQNPSPEPPAKKEPVLPEKKPPVVENLAAQPKSQVKPTPTPKPAREFRHKLKDDPLAKIKGKDIKELSGVTAASGGNALWGHTDNGNEAELYRFDFNGKILQKVFLGGVENNDWESMTRAANGNLLIGGFGDNDEKKTEYKIFECAEPLPGVVSVSKIKTYSFVYSDGKSHNCEAFFPLNQKIYLLTKRNDKDDPALLFCLDRLGEKGMNSARKIGKFNLEGRITDAAYSPERQILAVLTYEGIVFYSVKSEADLLSSPVLFVKVDFDQCEGICFMDGDLVIANESGELWKYPVDFFLK